MPGLDENDDTVRLLLAMETSPASSPASTCAQPSTWSEEKVVDDITVFRGVVPGCDWNAVKATGIVPCATAFLAAKLIDEAEMPRFDKMVARVTILNTNHASTTTTSVRHVQLKPVLVTKAREFVVETTTNAPSVVDDSATIAIASRSTAWPGVPPTASYVRGINFISGYILRPVVVVVAGNASSVGCHVTLIAHVDPGGLLPAVVMNLLAVDAPWKLLRRFRKLYAHDASVPDVARQTRALTRAIESTVAHTSRSRSAPPPRDTQPPCSGGGDPGTPRGLAHEQFACESVAILLAKASDHCVDTIWSHVKATSTAIDVFRGVVQGSDWTAVKATGVVRCSAARLASKLMDPTEIVRFDDMTASCRVLMTLPNSTTSVRHITAKPVFPTAARDFVVMSTMEVKPDDVVVIATRSMDHATAPATSTFVRGHINISGYILDPVDLGPEPACHVTMMAHMDLGGMLPAVVINLLSVEAPAKLLNKVRELYGTTGATASLPRRRLLPDVTACRNESTEARPDPGRSPNGGQVDGSPIARDALDNYAAFGNASIELLVANVSDASTIAWTEVKLHDGIAVYRGAVPNSDWNAVKATCVVQCPAWFLAGKLQNPADMTTFDTMTASCHVLADFSGRVSVRHVQAKPVFPTTARDFVVVTAVHEVAGSSSASDHQDRFVIASRSTTHPKAPETKQFVRGTNNISGYVVDGVDGGACRVTMMAHMDLGGMLPAVVINALAVDAPYKLLKRFRTLYELESFPRRPSIPPQPAAPATLLMESHQHLGPDVLGSTRVPDRTSYDPKTRTSRCYVCSNTMATFLLRHNCQICGHVVCGSCSTHRIHTNYWTTLRTCDTCVVHLQQKHVPALLPPQPSSTAAITTPASARAIEPALAIQPSSMFCYAFDQWKYGRRLASAAWVAGCLVLVLPVVLGVLSNSAMVDFAQAVKVYFDT